MSQLWEELELELTFSDKREFVLKGVLVGGQPWEDLQSVLTQSQVTKSTD